MMTINKNELGLAIGVAGAITLAVGIGWWMGQSQAHQQIVGLSNQQQHLQAQVASQSASLVQSEAIASGYRDYVTTHTSQKIEDQYLTGYSLPVDGLALPVANPLAMPGSVRAYRGGVHEGVDFFPKPLNTPVKAIGDGRIIRIDTAYVEHPHSYFDQLASVSQSIGFTSEDILDQFRGRQVWLLLPGNVIARYCHLNSTASLQLGQSVKRGDVLGGMGASGTMDEGIHLHLEIRVGNTYLGAGLPYGQLSQSYQKFFSH